MIVILIIGMLVDGVFSSISGGLRRRRGSRSTSSPMTPPGAANGPPCRLSTHYAVTMGACTFPRRSTTACARCSSWPPIASDDPDSPVQGRGAGRGQDIPPRFLEGILRQLRQSGIVASQRGADGGYRLAKPPDEITVADVFRALDGPLAAVRGDRPGGCDLRGAGGTSAGRLGGHPGRLARRPRPRVARRHRQQHPPRHHRGAHRDPRRLVPPLAHEQRSALQQVGMRNWDPCAWRLERLKIDSVAQDPAICA